jgi:hypothetical protein
MWRCVVSSVITNRLVSGISPSSVLPVSRLYHLTAVRSNIDTKCNELYCAITKEYDWRSWKSQDRPTPSLVRRPSAVKANIWWLESGYNQQWPTKSTQLHCRLSLPRGQREITDYKCAKCEVTWAWFFVSRNITQNWTCRPLTIVNSLCCDKILM